MNIKHYFKKKTPTVLIHQSKMSAISSLKIIANFRHIEVHRKRERQRDISMKKLCNNFFLLCKNNRTRGNMTLILMFLLKTVTIRTKLQHHTITQVCWYFNRYSSLLICRLFWLDAKQKEILHSPYAFLVHIFILHRVTYITSFDTSVILYTGKNAIYCILLMLPAFLL